MPSIAWRSLPGSFIGRRRWRSWAGSRFLTAEGRRQAETLGGRVKLALLDAELSAARGEEELASLLLQGATFGAVAVGWTAIRQERRRREIVGGSRRSRRIAMAAALLLDQAPEPMVAKIDPTIFSPRRFTA